MREVSFFWKIDRLGAVGLEKIPKIARRIEFLSYIKRAPKDIRCLFKFHLHDGQKVDDLKGIDALEVLEVIQEAEQPDEGHLVICRVIHPVPILNARTNGTFAVAGSKFDEEGLTYILQGSSMKLRLLSGVLRLIAKPDRTSARTLKLTPQNHESVLTDRQLKLAKYAYDRGYYDLPKRIKITGLAEQLGLARATISEHLTQIEGILIVFFQHGIEQKLHNIRHSGEITVTSYSHTSQFNNSCVDMMQASGTAGKVRKIMQQLQKTQDVDRVTFIPAPLRDHGCC